jgi:hypothetical protein
VICNSAIENAFSKETSETKKKKKKFSCKFSSFRRRTKTHQQQEALNFEIFFQQQTKKVFLFSFFLFSTVTYIDNINMSGEETQKYAEAARKHAMFRKEKKKKKKKKKSENSKQNRRVPRFLFFFFFFFFFFSLYSHCGRRAPQAAQGGA